MDLISNFKLIYLDPPWAELSPFQSWTRPLLRAELGPFSELNASSLSWILPPFWAKLYLLSELNSASSPTAELCLSSKTELLYDPPLNSASSELNLISSLSSTPLLLWDELHFLSELTSAASLSWSPPLQLSKNRLFYKLNYASSLKWTPY